MSLPTSTVTVTSTHKFGSLETTHRHRSTPTTTPTRPETNHIQVHTTGRKICRNIDTYGEFLRQPRAKAHLQKQTLPLSHGGGHEFESRRVHSVFPANARK